MGSLATATAAPSRPSSSASSAPGTNTHAVSLMRSLLNKTMRIAIADHRVFLGTFACMDKDKNIILVNAEEYRLPKPGESPDMSSSAKNLSGQGRFVGMIMIPWGHVTSCEAEADDDSYYT